MNDFSATANGCHALGFRIPAHNPKTTVFGQHGAQHHAVPRLEDVQGQHFLGEKHQIRQGKQGQFPYSQFTHGAAR
jgi:hypothetical protein